MSPTPTEVFNWIFNHFHLIGWSGLLAVCAYAIKVMRKADDFKARVLTVESNVNKMATNCMPTIQANTQATNEKLDRQTELLENINTGIAVLVDRGR
jgi:hypothetical protein